MADPEFQETMRASRKVLAEEMEELAAPTLSTARLKRGFSQSRVASIMNTSQSHISKIEAGEVKLHLDTAKRLADVLGISLDTLYSLLPNKPEKLENKPQSVSAFAS